MIGTKIRYLPIPNALTPHNPPFAPIRIVQPNHHRLPIFVSILVPIIVAPILVPIIVPIIGVFNHNIIPSISRFAIDNPHINPEAPFFNTPSLKLDQAPIISENPLVRKQDAPAAQQDTPSL